MAATVYREEQTGRNEGLMKAEQNFLLSAMSKSCARGRVYVCLCCRGKREPWATFIRLPRRKRQSPCVPFLNSSHSLLRGHSSCPTRSLSYSVRERNRTLSEGCGLAYGNFRYHWCFLTHHVWHNAPPVGPHRCMSH